METVYDGTIVQFKLTEETGMEHSASDEKEDTGSTLKSWACIIGFGIAIIAWGFLIYFTVGDKGQQPWDFGIIEDVPGKSQYSTTTPKENPGIVPRPGDIGPPEHQHVMGPTKGAELLKQEGKP